MASSIIKRQSGLYTSAPFDLIVSKKVSPKTSQYGTVNLNNAFGISANNAIPFALFGGNSAHSNGVAIEMLVVGTTYWARLRDFGTGAVINSETVDLYLTYIETANVGG